MTDVGLSYEAMAALPIYWKRVLLGYREPKDRVAIERENTDALAKMRQMMRMAGGGRG